MADSLRIDRQRCGRVVPLTLKQANELVERLHRHHKPVQGHRFSIGLLDQDGDYIGAIIVGRPVAQKIEQYRTAEVTRLVTNGTKNACSLLYAAAARAAAAMGYDKIQTYILGSEPGTSLRAAGWHKETTTKGDTWHGRRGRPTRRTDQPTCPKERWGKKLNG